MWGCLAKVLLPKPKKKLGHKTFDVAFIGYAENSVTYRFLVIKSKNGLMEVNSIIKTKNDGFFENIFPWKTNGQQQVQRNLRVESSYPPEPELGRSKRERKETNLDDGFYTFLVDDDPRPYKEAKISLDAPLYNEAINSEIELIMQNHIWEIVELIPDTKNIGCKWIFKRKLNHMGLLRNIRHV